MIWSNSGSFTLGFRQLGFRYHPWATCHDSGSSNQTAFVIEAMQITAVGDQHVIALVHRGDTP
jgi:hypothetical protein